MQRWLAAFLCLVLAGPLTAQTREAPDKVLTPYLSDVTIAAGTIDFQKIDAGALFRRLGSAQNKPELVQLEQKIKAEQAALLDAGVQKIYFRANLVMDPMDSVLFVLPGLKPEGRAAVGRLFAKVPGLQTETKDGVLLAGSKATLAGLGRNQPAAVPALAQGFAAVADSSQRVVVLLPAPLQRSWEELTPSLPPDLGGGPLKTVTRGLRWLAVGAEAGNKCSVRVIVQAVDADAARALQKIADSVIAKFAKDIGLPAEVVEALSLEADGAQLRLALSDRSIETVTASVVAKIRDAAGRTQALNNLRQIGLAMHSYHDVHGTFPPQASHDAQKKPLLSWRVHLLPYLEQGELYKEFKLDEPWDSDHNKKLIARMPGVYRSSLSKIDASAGKTTYVVPSGATLMFDGSRTMRLQGITDGSSNTILALDVADVSAVVWTQPEDLKVNLQMPRAGVMRAGGATTLFADGSVRALRPTVTDATFRALLTPAGGEVVQPDGD